MLVDDYAECFNTAMCLRQDLQRTLDDLQPLRPRHGAAPHTPSAARDHTGVQFDFLRVSQPQIRYEFVSSVEQMVYLALEYGDTGEDEMAFIRAAWRSRFVEVEKVHKSPQFQVDGDYGDKKTAGRGYYTPGRP